HAPVVPTGATPLSRRSGRPSPLPRARYPRVGRLSGPGGAGFMTTTPYPSPTPIPAGSVLDGDPRVLIPLPEAAARLGISRWQAYKLARSGRLPSTRLGARDLHVPAAVLRRIEQESPPPGPDSDGGEVA